MGSLANRTVGLLLCAITALVICREWGVAEWTQPAKPFLVLVVVAILLFQVRWSRKAFVAVAMLISISLVATNTDWRGIITRGLETAAFIGAFFTALSTLRTVAQTSPAIQRAGTFLAGQPPGRRYAALTVGGQAFALLLNYGSLQLLGSLVTANANSEPNVEIRRHRIRRMLLAIQRAFVSALPWSPLSFAVAITVSVIPDTSWSKALAPGLMTSFLLAGIGWSLDTIFKPRLTVKPVRSAPVGTWATMLPMAVLLAVLFIGVVTLSALTQVRVVGIVAVIVPCIAVVWMHIQHWHENPVSTTCRRIKTYVLQELPSYRGELTLLMMAGFIGTAGSQLFAPMMQATGFDLSFMPSWIILISLVWIIPIAGQIGMNPILVVTLIAPLIPTATDLGVQPIAIVVAITSGWALSGASSPFTATTLLIGSFGGISATRVGLVWNGAYTLICGVVLSIWVITFAYLF
ncbi:hypothetical protein TG4357_01874 [Thalassovita gelatinovora]|uniref:H+/gluconate symporter n=2 Tax=Thalassovita gelatinovora TaxID=53501 RepID=A0A0P1FC78_THAGE|nr:hypothetical protein HFZ77_05985 [Thalassovita gelatinovora]CUH65457.1 hypothetical protein TG4357_01874 [Thalassovita gelatinovora]SER09349.1 hypothetical protein SAMN04488043_11576 [Thalassovita gelatinovora]